MNRNRNGWQTLLMILGIVWIVLPDPVIGPIDDFLVVVLEALPIITQAVNKLRSSRYKYGRGNEY